MFGSITNPLALYEVWRCASLCECVLKGTASLLAVKLNA